jgi:hypothetical protein
MDNYLQQKKAMNCLKKGIIRRRLWKWSAIGLWKWSADIYGSGVPSNRIQATAAEALLLEKEHWQQYILASSFIIADQKATPKPIATL